MKWKRSQDFWFMSIPSAGSISEINFITNYSISICILLVNRYLKLKDIKQ